jgi:hypothetical protein
VGVSAAARSASYGHLTPLRVAPGVCPLMAGFNEFCSVRIAGAPTKSLQFKRQYGIYIKLYPQCIRLSIPDRTPSCPQKPVWVF